MMRRRFLSFMLVGLVASSILVVAAQQQGTTTITSNSLENFYVADQDILVKNTIGDVYAASETMRVSERVVGDIVYAGRKMQVEGEVQGDVRAVGQTLNVGNTISGDVVLAGATVELGADSEVGGDVIIAAGDSVALRGAIDGDVRLALLGSGSSLDIYGTIEGDVSVINYGRSNIVIHDSAVIRGAINHQSYRSDSLSIAEGATILNQPSFRALERDDGVSGIIQGLVFFIILGLLSFLLFRRHIQAFGYVNLKTTGMMILYGIGFLVVTLLVGVVFAALLDMFPLGFFAAIICFVAIFIAGLSAPAVLGNLIWRLARRSDSLTLLSSIIGSLVIAILFWLPLLSVILTILILYCIGVIASSLITVRDSQ